MPEHMVLQYCVSPGSNLAGRVVRIPQTPEDAVAAKKRRAAKKGGRKGAKKGRKTAAKKGARKAARKSRKKAK
jgi:hypothetical protein